MRPLILLLVGIVVLVCLGYIVCTRTILSESFGPYCPLHYGNPLQCRHLNERECNQCSTCRWYIDRFNRGKCVHRNRFRPIQYVNGGQVYWGTPGHIPPAPPVRSWWGTGPWFSTYWTRPSSKPHYMRRRRHVFRRPVRGNQTHRRYNHHRIYTRDPWGRRIRILS
jgi:hypothetical protein